MMHLTEEEKYIRMRLKKAAWQSIPFYLFRIFPINKRKIVFTCIEGTTGYTCNPKYIAEEFLNSNYEQDLDSYELIWLVNDTSKNFPKEIKVYKNSLLNRAFHLTTAKFWIDNSRKQLECRKRKGQIYIQTWHAKLGFKPTCLDRGESFSKIAYLVSKHDSDMVDYWLSNSDWYDRTLKTGSLYEGKTLRTGSPRCDVLVEANKDKAYKDEIKKQICKIYNIVDNNVHFLMYAPTFRGGSQVTNRELSSANHAPDYILLKEYLEKKFGGTRYILLRLHPQLIARNMGNVNNNPSIFDASRIDDMYEILAGCDAFMTDYSSAAFDAMVMEIPIFLYCDDYSDYEKERGSLLWNLRKLPFGFAMNDEELRDAIASFDDANYKTALNELLSETGMVEDGRGSCTVCEFIKNL